MMSELDRASPGMTATLADNIERLTRRRREEAQAERLSHKVADRITRFTGSMLFVVIHLVLFGGWILINLGWLPIVAPFDPSFVVLAMAASVEAIFLSTFVLISQNRMAAAADRRADLDLHINLLAEHELSKLAGVVAAIAERVGVPARTADVKEIERSVDAEVVLDALGQKEVE
ncbi:DUF1003 domain-containing protein [Sphingomonas sp.]|uniref:DUF1003 domain-containing protein n=1 Tax=Sphingomonas sp. TaxID=28214 RepID=UPI002D7E4297|nr:DUF1003 domain-containing protein [Sphingomonas sp.]HEU0045014.1 DUF1003 domain-containing protein [Sphingomonas sp.]